MVRTSARLAAVRTSAFLLDLEADVRDEGYRGPTSAIQRGSLFGLAVVRAQVCLRNAVVRTDFGCMGYMSETNWFGYVRLVLYVIRFICNAVMYVRKSTYKVR